MKGLPTSLNEDDIRCSPRELPTIMRPGPIHLEGALKYFISSDDWALLTVIVIR